LARIIEIITATKLPYIRCVYTVIIAQVKICICTVQKYGILPAAREQEWEKTGLAKPSQTVIPWVGLAIMG
jgi:hypothetical protein